MSQARYIPRRGDFIWMDFNPRTGHEQAGRRPALVLSMTEYNRQVGLAVVCPIISEAKGYPWEVPIPLGGFLTCVVLSDQIENVDWLKRSAAFISTGPAELLTEVLEKAIALVRPDEADDGQT